MFSNISVQPQQELVTFYVVPQVLNQRNRKLASFRETEWLADYLLRTKLEGVKGEGETLQVNLEIIHLVHTQSFPKN